MRRFAASLLVELLDIGTLQRDLQAILSQIDGPTEQDQQTRHDLVDTLERIAGRIHELRTELDAAGVDWTVAQPPAADRHDTPRQIEAAFQRAEAAASRHVSPRPACPARISRLPAARFVRLAARLPRPDAARV
jgi:hypothetical protein